MKNPYRSPESESPVDQNSEVPRARWPRVLLILISTVGLVLFSVAASMLISQSFRYQASLDQVPPMARSATQDVAIASYIVGQTAVAGAIASVLAALLAMRKRIVWGWLVVGISTIAFVLVAIIFRPI